MKKYSILILNIIIVMALLVVGCSSKLKGDSAQSQPKEDPVQVLNQYYEKLNNGKIEEAYELLSNETKEKVTKENFIKFQRLQKEICSSNEFKVQKTNEYKEKEVDGIKFKDIIEYDITEKGLYNGKADVVNSKKFVVNNNGVWKIYRPNENINKLIASNLIILARCYAGGEGGKTKDSNQAAILLNESLKYDSNADEVHYLLASVYDDLDRFDEAMEHINIYLQKTSDKKKLSYGYNILGILNEKKGIVNKAFECYSKALELDSNNQYAKTNVERLK